MSEEIREAPSDSSRGRDADRALRITFVCPRPGLAGGIRTVRQLGEELIHRGHRVTVVYPTEGPKFPRPWRVRRFLRAVRRAWRERGSARHHLDNSPLPCIAVPGSRVTADDVPDADVVIGTFWNTMEWIRTWPESKGLKAHYVQGFETFAAAGTGNDPSKLERILDAYRHPSLKLAVSTWLRDLMVERFEHERVALVPCAIDWDQFDSQPRPKPSIPTVGVLFSRKEIKGTTTAFEAIRIAQREVPHLRVVSFGAPDGPGPGDNVPAHLEFHLGPSQRTIPDLYRQCTCWIVPSTTEGFGLPGLEAAANRNPIVTTDCGGPVEYTRPGENGYVVPIGDSRELAARLLDILRSSDREWLEMSEASYRIANEFRWEKSAEALEAAIHKDLDLAGRAR